MWPSGPHSSIPAVRKIIYTTNAIEALNAKLRRAVRARGHFPNDEAAIKLIFLVLRQVELAEGRERALLRERDSGQGRLRLAAPPSPWEKTSVPASRPNGSLR
jgi:transposase-like protein